MIIVLPETNAALARASASEFVDRMTRWLTSRFELQAYLNQISDDWAHAEIERANAFSIDSEDAVARFCRLRLLRSDDWFAAPHQQEILSSERSGNLKVFQLECADEGIGDDTPPSPAPATVGSGQPIVGEEGRHA